MKLNETCFQEDQALQTIIQVYKAIVIFQTVEISTEFTVKITKYM